MVGMLTGRGRWLVAISATASAFAVALLVWALAGPLKDTKESARGSLAATTAIKATVEAVNRSIDLTSCRAQMSAEIVGVAQDRAERAGRQYVAAIGEGLIAAGRGDDVGLATAADRLDQMLAEYLNSGQALSDARDQYAAAAAQATTDPDAFLDACRSRNAGEHPTGN